tara:strand:- start:1496 stop:1957 length:462 start_codon:yes stop_codon:yes gene_type:complete
VKKKFYKSIILFLIVSACGYNPIFSKNNSKFKLISINLEGDKRINRIINGKLESFSNNINAEKNYRLKIKTNIKKNIVSKDTKGNTDTLSLDINVFLILEDSNQNKSKKNFIKSISYNNIDNKFELSNYEKSIKDNMAEKISEEMLIYIQSIQ